MKHICVLLLACAALAVGSARAAPPTVVPSPGYDARLQEQRAALRAASEPTIPKQASPRHHKRSRVHK
ncbi:hypothetical protein ACFFWD_26390 [Bradyrhizobium erythrophlei]|uniref:hypothetical protein n=1 Tax=Bradyrhizobium erythrophlei TaxID=1437360 RepID=UPI0035EB1F1D